MPETRQDAEWDRLAEIAWKARRSCADDLRKAGLTVAVHNDYRQEGVAHTFWLMTAPLGGQVVAFKGEGATDEDALDQIRAAWAAVTDKLHHAPRCPANHYHGGRAPTGRCSCGAEAHARRTADSSLAHAEAARSVAPDA